MADGTIVNTLEGAGSALDAVFWSSDDGTVSARGIDARAFTWRAFRGLQLSRSDGVGYVRVARLIDGDLIAVTTNGEVRLLDDDGGVLRTVAPPVVPTLIIAAASDGTRVAVLADVGAQTTAWVWDRDTGRTTRSRPIGCAASDVAFANTRLIVSCSDDHMAAIDIDSGRVSVVPSDEQWLSVAVRRGTIYVGSSLGGLSQLSNDLQTSRPIAALACGGPVRAVVSTDSDVFAIGADATQSGCMAYAHLAGSGTLRSGIAPPLDSRYCIATATSLDGSRLALGCDDGTVLVLSSDLEPLWKGSVTPGAIRTVAFDSASSLLVGTRDGRLSRVSLPALSPSAERRAATVEAARAMHLGLYRPRSS